MQVMHVFREVSRVSAGPRLDESCLFVNAVLKRLECIVFIILNHLI